MHSLVVGTAGHIDHGKSALVHALTGIDPDRLKEEQARGITIDLGFAHATVGDVDDRVRRRAGPRAVRAQHAGGRRRHRRGAARRRRRRVGDAADARALRDLPAARRRARPRRPDESRSASTTTRSSSRRSRRASSSRAGFWTARRSCRCRRGRAPGSTLCARRSPRWRAGAPRLARDGVVRLPVDRVFTMKGFGTVVTGTLVSGDDRGRGRSSSCCRRGGPCACAACRCTAATSTSVARRAGSR